ncbi:hypothetical protein [Ligilactobacillus equi]
MKKMLFNADGKLNSKTVTSLAALAIVLVQEIAGLFGWQLKGDTNQIMDIVNTLLTILGLLGLASTSADVKDVVLKQEIKEQAKTVKSTETKTKTRVMSLAETIDKDGNVKQKGE